MVGFDVIRQQGCRQVFIDHRFDTGIGSIVFCFYGDASSSGGNNDDAVLQEKPDHINFENFSGNWGGNDTPKAAARILFDLPPVFLLSLHGCFFCHKGSDGFRGVLKGRVFPRYLHLGHHGGGGPRQTVPGKDIIQGHHDIIAQGSLGVGNAGIHRYLMKLVGRQFPPPEDKPDLGAVAVDQGNFMPRLDELYHVFSSFLRRQILILYGYMLVIYDEGIPPHRQDDCFSHSFAPFV